MGGKDVVTHLREALPQDWKATLSAIDGSVAGDVARQIAEIPRDATHLVVSVGGNDALMNADLLQMPANSAAEILAELAKRTDVFERQYRAMLESVLSKNLPTALSTVYYPNFPERAIQRLAIAALANFNDVIIRRATLNRLPLLDLRLICSEPSDYANPIEPSDKGGKKIAAKILELTESHDFSNSRTVVYF
jgi:hypothetical protein